VEPGLQELINTAGKRLRATLSHEEAITKSDVTFVLVATPSNSDGSFSNGYVESTLKSLGGALSRHSKRYHLFVINSTVMPGSIEETLIPLLEEFSGRKLNVGFGVCYCPELVALGSVVKDFLNPDLVVIGQSSPRDGARLASIYKRLCENDPPIFHMSIITAELTKVSLNCYLTLKISFANSLANLCERMPGADLDVVTGALGADSRIAPYYLRGGLSFGGTCFPRDTRAYIALAEGRGVDTDLMRAVERVNDLQDKHLLEVVLSHASFNGDGKVSILGLSFKPNTPVIIESPAIKLIDNLLKRGMEVTVYDPLAMENAKAIFGSTIRYAGSVRDCVARSPVCVITTQSNEFKSIDESTMAHDPTTIIDCWRILDPAPLGKRVRYVALGRACANDPLSEGIIDRAFSHNVNNRVNAR
jgi:UDPglucose 6-dehydrogenase